MVSPRLRAIGIGLALLLALLPLQAAGQAGGTIRGRVVDATTGRPLPNAEVYIPGTSRNAPTNAGGDFLLLNVPAGTHNVRVTLLGYAARDQAVTVAAGQVSQVTFELSVAAIALDQIVVTGTGGATSKRTIGNSISKVDAADVAGRTAITTLTELLQAKTPGLQILPNSGTLGAAADIRIRGAGSLTNIKPMVFIDGVRYNTEGLGNFTPSGAGITSYTGQATSAFDFINPNDIESIEVVKGPAAATLYGAEAANGVIQIITKKGRRGDRPMRWDLRTEYGQNEWALEIPDNYTTCTAAYIAAVDAAGAPVWPGCQGLAAGTVIRGNPLRDDPLALRTGDVMRAAVSANGGGERYNYYFAADRNEENGIFRNNFNNRTSLRANFTIQPNDWLDLYVSSSYARAHLRLPVGDESAQGMLLSAFRGRPGRVTTNPLNSGWATTRAEQANAYNNQTKSDRLTLNSTITLAPIQWFSNRITLGFDYTSSMAQVLSPPGSVDADYAGVLSLGSVGQRVPRAYVYTIDYMGKVDRPLTADLTSTTSVGAQAVSRRTETIYASGTGLGAPDITLVGAAATTVGSNSYSENKSLGFFVQERLGWKNRLFVTAALRADDNSSFGKNFDMIYYPKAEVAWVASEEPLLTGLLQGMKINNLKLRSAWGEAGQAPSPFAATQIYTVDKVVLPDGTVTSALRTSSYGNPDLKAEHGSEFEVGFDAGLLEDRVALEFTYYDKRMKDVIIAISPPSSSGFAGTFYGSTSSILRNLGETHNSGLELSLTGTPVQTRRFAWDAFLSVATNQNELVEFGDARTFMNVGGQSYGTVQQHREGYPLGGYWWRLPVRNEDGTPMVYTHTNGTRYAVVSDSTYYLGSPTPKREISLGNTFTLFRDFRLFVLFDHKGGHRIFNYREYNRCAVQLNCERYNDPSVNQTADTILWRSTAPVSETAAREGRASTVSNGMLGYWTEKADFIKLRDVSLQYTLPTAVARSLRASAAAVTVAGHNLALWSDYSGVDPEVNGYGTGLFARADVYPVPMLRRWSLSFNLSF